MVSLRTRFLRQSQQPEADNQESFAPTEKSNKECARQYKTRRVFGSTVKILKALDWTSSTIQLPPPPNYTDFCRLAGLGFGILAQYPGST